MTPCEDMERVILGACLKEDEAATELACVCLKPQHFLLDSHRRIFRHISALHSADKPVSEALVIQELATAREIDTIGGIAYVMSLQVGVPRFMGERIREYAERLKEYWRVRQILALGESLRNSEGQTSSELIHRATGHLEAIAGDSEVEDATISSSIVGFLDRVHEKRQMQRSPGMSYGLNTLDSQTDGMMPGEQTAVGAISGVGKTAFMCQAIFAALRRDLPVDAFLLEPTKDQVTARLISLFSGVRYEALIKPWKMRADEIESTNRGANWLAERPLRMFANSTMTLDEVLGQARLGMHRLGTKLICLDYIQRLKIRASEKDEPVRLRVGRASMALADLVKNSQTHSMILSQITTGRKSGAASMPTMFDFRESSQIENDAHTIVLLYRQFNEEQNHYTENGAIFIPKQRNGVPSNMKVGFDSTTAAWRESNV